MTKFLEFIALVLLAIAAYIAMCFGSWCLTQFANSPFCLLVVPVGIWLFVKIAKAAFTNEGNN